MTTKLKIDLAQGILEVEGSETFVKAIYSDFKSHFVGEETAEELVQPRRRRRKTDKVAKTKVGPAAADGDKGQPVETAAPKTEEEKEAQKPGPSKRAYTLIDNLDFTPANGRPSLVEYMDSKFPITNEERLLVFLHYMQHLMKLTEITPDHIYTCFKAAKVRVPFSIENTLQATAKQRRWIKVAKDGTLTVTPAGKLYVENQLPKKKKN